MSFDSVKCNTVHAVFEKQILLKPKSPSETSAHVNPVTFSFISVCNKSRLLSEIASMHSIKK